MRVAFIVFFFIIGYAAAFPSFNNDDESNSDFELELRSLLNDADEQQMTRALVEDNDNDDDEEEEYSFSKRQGGHNMVGKGTKCEIECVHRQRNPQSGKGKTIKQAAAFCKNLCVLPTNKRVNKKANPKTNKFTSRSIDDDESSSEEQQVQRREFYNLLQKFQ